MPLRSSDGEWDNYRDYPWLHSRSQTFNYWTYLAYVLSGKHALIWLPKAVVAIAISSLSRDTLNPEPEAGSISKCLIQQGTSFTWSLPPSSISLLILETIWLLGSIYTNRYFQYQILFISSVQCRSSGTKCLSSEKACLLVAFSVSLWHLLELPLRLLSSRNSIWHLSTCSKYSYLLPP